MKPLRAPLRYLHDRPENGVPVEVAPGILWLRLALPFALDHVNVWLLDDGDAWTIMDTGLADDGTRAIWESLLAGLLAGKPVSRVIATHFHPDHAGLAGWLCERTGAELLMTRTEWLTARMLKLDETPSFSAIGAAYDRRAGLPEDWIEQRKARGNLYRRGVSLPSPSYRRLQAGDHLTIAGSDWQVIIGEGHAPEMLTFHSLERNMLIAADQILPRISPIVGVWPMLPDGDPLGEFIASLDRYRDIDAGCDVLPSHDGPFHGLIPRLGQLAAHHEERLSVCLDACAEPASAAQVMRRLFRRDIDLQQVGFALAETLAHLNHLRNRGTLTRESHADGTDRYRRT